MPQTPIATYLQRIDKALKAENATEHTHRPALKTLIEELRTDVTATNEPQRIECGSPDFIVMSKNTPLGHIEAKDVGTDLDRVEVSEQLTRYRTSLHNLILTDYLEFRLYRNGELVKSVCLGNLQRKGVLRRNKTAFDELTNLLSAFFDAQVPTISSPRELAERMARIARLLHDLIRQAFSKEGAKGDLHGQYESFKKVLIADLSVDQFADMYAQTIAYGLFAARCNHTGSDFMREHAWRELPKTNPFLRRLFNAIAGADLDDRIAWVVDDLAELLAKADMASILEDFGKAKRQEDPVVHFYETFLSAYDPKLRETRGVYYTPEPVVNYIVRSVEAALEKDFRLKQGLADRSMVRMQVPTPHGKKKSKQITTHRVQILDPACGTGTFLHAVVAQIAEAFDGGAGQWPSYVAEHLLPRVYGFELLMAPYAVAHMKLGLQLQDTGYDFAAEERLRVFLTNSLEEAHEHAGLPLFARWLADEAEAASEIKRHVPIMVVLGNPPYSGHSVNKGAWIEELMESYKKSPELRKPAQAKWLSDDYVKFVRFAQWRIEQTGYGILGFVTNHSYLDNPTFLDMRSSLMSTFDDIYVLDMHGSTKRKEHPPTDEKDENVFDIQQGVAVCLMVRRRTNAHGTSSIHHADLWGSREAKYEWLASHDIRSTEWTVFHPQPPQCLFVPQDTDRLTEYERGCSLAELMNVNGDPAPGIVTTHDQFAISWTRKEAIDKVESLLRTENEEEARSLWRLCSQSQWSYERAKRELANNDWREWITPILYRPFDERWTILDRNVAVHRRERVMRHMLRPNLALVTCRQVGGNEWSHALVTTLIGDDSMVSNRSKERGFLLPLYLDNVDDEPSLFNSTENRSSNFNAAILTRWFAKLQLHPTPEQLLAYIYAVLYSPSYRLRYADFLRRDFPRVPLTKDASLFKRLSELGQGLIDLHIMKTTASPKPDYPIAGSNKVDRVRFDEMNGRVYINDEQYFDAVSEVTWTYYIGSYQVAHKWLKDRKGRMLTFNELDQYRNVVAALDGTIRLQEEIDRAVGEWPID